MIPSQGEPTSAVIEKLGSPLGGQHHELPQLATGHTHRSRCWWWDFKVTSHLGRLGGFPGGVPAVGSEEGGLLLRGGRGSQKGFFRLSSRLFLKHLFLFLLLGVVTFCWGPHMFLEASSLFSTSVQVCICSSSIIVVAMFADTCTDGEVSTWQAFEAHVDVL